MFIDKVLFKFFVWFKTLSVIQLKTTPPETLELSTYSKLLPSISLHTGEDPWSRWWCLVSKTTLCSVLSCSGSEMNLLVCSSFSPRLLQQRGLLWLLIFILLLQDWGHSEKIINLIIPVDFLWFVWVTLRHGGHTVVRRLVLWPYSLRSQVWVPLELLWV